MMDINYSKSEILQLNDEITDSELPAKVIWGEAEEFPPSIHWHKNIEINFLISGEWFVNINGDKTYVKGRQVTIVNSKVVHWMIWKNYYERDNFVVVFYYDFLKSYLPNIDDIIFVLPDDFSEDNPLFQHLLELSELCRTMYEEKGIYDSSLMDGLMGIKIKSLLYLLAYDLLHECKVDKKNRKRIRGMKYQSRIIQACNYLEKNYQKDIKLMDLANELCLSEGHCSRHFKQYTGVTFSEYLSDVRLFYAHQMLISTDKTVMEIAMTTGFPDLRSFQKRFEMMYKMTPTEYRKKQNKFSAMEISESDSQK